MTIYPWPQCHDRGLGGGGGGGVKNPAQLEKVAKKPTQSGWPAWAAMQVVHLRMSCQAEPHAERLQQIGVTLVVVWVAGKAGRSIESQKAHDAPMKNRLRALPAPLHFNGVCDSALRNSSLGASTWCNQLFCKVCKIHPQSLECKHVFICTSTGLFCVQSSPGRP